MTEFTAHLRIPIPDFNQDPWHAELETAIRALDTAFYEALLVQGVANWANSTVYSIGSIVIDSATGFMWTCAIANTSTATPTTFAQERVAHPTFWNATANIPQQRGTWTTATSYIPGDFVVDTNRYAVCLVAHVSGTFNTDLAAAKWSVLIDLSSLGVGINATAEDTIASAATTDIGSKTATRLNVTGAVNITSFGVVANTFKILRFTGVLTLTNSANLILFSANITTEVGDVAFFSSDSTGKWRCYFYTRASGVPIGQPDASETVKGIAELATQGEVDAGTDAIRVVTPATLSVRLAALTTSITSSILGGVGATLDTLLEIANAIGLLAPKNNPTFTGTVDLGSAATVVTPTANDDDTSVPTTAFVNDAAKWTRQVFISGSGTWTRPAGCKRIFVQYIGAGGGGGGEGAGNGSGGNGGTTIFNSINANGGTGGGPSAGNGGAGGTGGTGSASLRLPGSAGLGPTGGVGGQGGAGQFGGAGQGFKGVSTGGAGGTNTGGGGGGGGNTTSGAGGGGAGEYVELVIDNPSGTYSYTVGAAGSAGAGASPGGIGGSGLIIVWEYYFVP